MQIDKTATKTLSGDGTVVNVEYSSYIKYTIIIQCKKLTVVEYSI